METILNFGFEGFLRIKKLKKRLGVLFFLAGLPIK